MKCQPNRRKTKRSLFTSRRKPRGAVLVMVLVCLLVVSTMSISLARTIVNHHRQSKRHQFKLQAMWLAEAAVDRAVAQIRKTPDYQGESWKVGADELDGRHAGVATIHVERLDDASESIAVRVEADFPSEPTNRARISKQVTIKLRAGGDAP